LVKCDHPLTALIETVEGRELMIEGAVMAAQYFLGNAHQHMSQERHKKALMNLNLALKLMANDEKAFVISYHVSTKPSMLNK